MVSKRIIEGVWQKFKSHLQDLYSITKPGMDALLISPVNGTSEGTGDRWIEVSSVLGLIRYMDPHFRDVIEHLNNDELVLDIRRSLRRSLHVFE